MSDFYAKFDALKEELSDGLDKTSASYLLDTADGKIVFGVCDKTEGEFYILMVQDCVKFLEVVERKRTEKAPNGTTNQEYGGLPHVIEQAMREMNFQIFRDD